jgi:hypothetical protein
MAVRYFFLAKIPRSATKPDEIIDRLAYGVEKIGVSKGDHVAFIHPNSPQVLFGYYSGVKARGGINNGHETSGEIYVS